MERGLYKFSDGRVFFDIGKGCGNSCKYCYLEDANEQQTLYSYSDIERCINEIVKNPNFVSGNKGTIISFCPHTEPLKSVASAKLLLHVIDRFAPYGNYMQFATKEILYDFFINEINNVTTDGQVTAFISISSLEHQKAIEPLASDYLKRVENVEKLRNSKMRSCIYLKPFLFQIADFEILKQLIVHTKPDAVCIGIVYNKVNTNKYGYLMHPTEQNMVSQGINQLMIKFTEILKQSSDIPVYYTSTCVIAGINRFTNTVQIPKALCVSCNEECMREKWQK